MLQSQNFVLQAGGLHPRRHTATTHLHSQVPLAAEMTQEDLAFGLCILWTLGLMARPPPCCTCTRLSAYRRLHPEATRNYLWGLVQQLVQNHLCVQHRMTAEYENACMTSMAFYATCEYLEMVYPFNCLSRHALKSRWMVNVFFVCRR